MTVTTRFVAHTGLPFCPQETFGRADLDARHGLYKELAKKVWDPDHVLREVGA